MIDINKSLDMYDEWVDEVLTGIEKNNEVYLHSSTSYDYWLNRAILYNRPLAIKMILDTLQVPDNLTLKERITYYQLL